MMGRVVALTILLGSGIILGQSGSERGTLSVHLPPDAAGLFLNDSMVICDKVCNLSLAPGAYRIRVPHPDRADTRWPDFVTQVEIREGQHAEVNAQWSELHRIETTPPGCNVFLADRFIGQTPLDVDLSATTEIRIRLEKDGFQSRTLLLDSTILRSAVMTYKLVSLDPNRRVGENLFAGTIEKQDAFQRNRTRIILLGGAALVAGSVAAYYKSQADHAFENAKLARRIGDQEAKRHYLDRAAKFDRYSAVGYVGMQVNVVGVFYFLFQSN